MIGGFGAGAAAGFAVSTGILSIGSVFGTVFPKAINAARDVLTVSTKLGRALGVGFIIVLAAVLILGSILADQEQQKMIEAMRGLQSAPSWPSSTPAPRYSSSRSRIAEGLLS